IRLEDHRRACGLRTVLDQDVHGIAVPNGFALELGHDSFERNVALPRFLAGFLFISRLGPDRLGVRDQVLLNPVQVFHDSRLLAVLVLTLTYDRGDGVARDPRVLLDNHLVRLALKAANLIEGLADGQRELLAPLAQSLPFFFRQTFNFFRAHLPIPRVRGQRDDDRAHRRKRDGEPPLLRPLGQALDQMAALLLQLPVNLIAQIAILATLEGPPGLITHGLDQFGHVVSKSRAGAGGQAHTERLAGALQIGDAEPFLWARD